MQQTQGDVLSAEEEFFRLLKAADAAGLESNLANDFILIDLNGTILTREAFHGAIGSGLLKFDRIDPSETSVRLYGATAVTTGRTVMEGRLGEMAFEVNSRYTHVFVRTEAKWLLVSAQGTQIQE